MKARHWMPCIITAIGMSATAQEHMVDPNSVRDETPLQRNTYGGLVANQTMTVAGYEFYRYFTAAWRDKEGSERYMLSVHEQPSARFGSRIWIELSNRRIFQANLPPARASLRPLGEHAAALAYAAAVDAEVEQALYRNPDLAQDELH